ncbi:MAG: gamma-glutamyl-phosphate reductase, partial [Synechococcales cyanobacterium]
MVSSLIDIAQQTRQASQSLASMPTDVKNGAIAAIARSLNDSAAEILAANRADCLSAQALGISPSLFARLKLDEVKLASAIAGMEEVIRLPDPVGIVQLHRQLDTHLVLQRITCPLGVLGVIFEARPDAVMQITSLAIKSGNGVILKGGVEATQSCQALVLAIQRGLAQT